MARDYYVGTKMRPKRALLLALLIVGAAIAVGAWLTSDEASYMAATLAVLIGSR